MATAAISSNDKRKAKKFSYEWEGKDAKGGRVSGMIDAPNQDMVKAQLRRQGVIPTKVRKKTQSRFGGGSNKITPADIAIFARQLTTMMSAGVPLVQAFEIVGNGLDNKAMRSLVLDVKADVESGSGLAVAMAKHPNEFDNLFCSLVAAGEQSGTLENLLNEIATYKEKTEALKAKIKKAMFYPAAVLVVAFIVTAILLIFVVPQFESLFKGMGSDLPAFTQFVVNLSEMFQQWWYIIFGGVAGAFILFVQMRKRSKAFAAMIDRVSLKLPVIGDILTKAATARFARTLSTMSSAGVPLVEAMDSVASTAGNTVFYNAIMRIKDEASTGQRLQVSLRQSGLFSSMVVQMVAIGEESGALDEMLAKVADYYEQEVDNAVDSLTSLMEPAIMSFLGVVVGGLVIAMYLPIFKMGDAF
ncbi:MAG: type II secretion system F family protein [Pseudomonadota bacterium]